MLVFTRRLGDKILINPDTPEQITIALLKDEGSRGIRIGIDAPEHIKIYRDDLWNQIKRGKDL